MDIHVYIHPTSGRLWAINHEATLLATAFKESDAEVQNIRNGVSLQQHTDGIKNQLYNKFAWLEIGEVDFALAMNIIKCAVHCPDQIKARSAFLENEVAVVMQALMFMPVNRKTSAASEVAYNWAKAHPNNMPGIAPPVRRKPALQGRNCYF